jgi:hypothetical protein
MPTPRRKSTRGRKTTTRKTSASRKTPAARKTTRKATARKTTARKTTAKTTRKSTARKTSSRKSTARARSQAMPSNVTPEERRWVERYRQMLSPSTLRAKWTHSPDERGDRPGQTLATKSVEVIRSWAERRRAQPVTVAGSDSDRPRTLRFTFPRGEDTGGRLAPVDWDAWLRTFQERDLVFLYQETRSNGGQSNFWRLDNPHREEG